MRRSEHATSGGRSSLSPRTGRATSSSTTRVVGLDFPFCVPHALLRDPRFAADVGYKDGAFNGWRSFNWWVAQRLLLTDPLAFTPFALWRDRAERARLWKRRVAGRAGRKPVKLARS